MYTLQRFTERFLWVQLNCFCANDHSYKKMYTVHKVSQTLHCYHIVMIPSLPAWYIFPLNTVIMSGLLEFPVPTWIWWINYRDGYIGLFFALATSHESFANSWNVASPNLSCMYYLSRCSYELAELVRLLLILLGVQLII